MRALTVMLVSLVVFLAVAWWLQSQGQQEWLLIFLSFAIAFPVAYLVIDRMAQKNQLLRMKEEALRAELSLLKNQINPHFFFNTLHNLYGLAMEKSDLTPTLILKLSDLMRFTIYQGKKDHVLLRDEVAYLENYLEIQRIRSQAQVVDLVFEKEIEDDLIMVPPLLFIMLVENAFKHGVASLAGKAYVHLQLVATDRWVEFKATNNFEPAKDKPKGIGLTNMKRRLALLFPNRHQYRTSVENDVYTASLRLEL